MALNALKKLSAMRMKPQNPLLKRMQGMSNEMREKMVKNYEGERARLLAMQREELYGIEDENMLMAGERRRYELAQREEIGKTASFLMKKGYPKIQAQALAVAFGAKMIELKKGIAEKYGDAKAKIVLKEITDNLLMRFKDKQSMSYLIREIRSHEKSFSGEVFNEEIGPILQKHGVDLD